MPFTTQRKQALLRFGALLLTLAVSGLIPPQTGAQEQKKDARVLFVSDHETPDEYAIYAMNPDGSGQTRISKGKGVAFDPAWSPDHKQIVYSFFTDKKLVKDDLMVMKADGSEPTRLIPAEENMVFLSPSWSPDGKQIAYYAITFKDKQAKNYDFSIYVVDADGKNRKKLGDGIAPVWSPDGKQILFGATMDPKRFPDLKIMDTDGTHVRPLTTKGVGVSYSSDGKRILFTKGESLPNVFVMDADGSHINQLTNAEDAGSMGSVWSPDGKHILYTRIPIALETPKMKPIICQIDVDGKNQKEIKADAFIGAGFSLLLVMLANGF